MAGPKSRSEAEWRNYVSELADPWGPDQTLTPEAAEEEARVAYDERMASALLLDALRSGDLVNQSGVDPSRVDPLVVDGLVAQPGLDAGEQVRAYGDFFVDPLLNLASSAPGLMSRSLARRGGGELPPLTPDDERAALDAALMGVTGPVGRVGGKAWRWLSQTPGLTRSVPGGWRTFAGGPVHGSPAAPVSGRRGKAEKLHDLASDPRTPAHEAAAARSAYENLTGESLSPPSGRASMRAAYEARAPKPGRVGVREAHAKARPELVATSEEIPLGLSRPPVRDVSLEGMADDAFGEHWKNINRHLSGLERRFDEDLALERDPAFRRELAEAQDEWVAADMERFRRDIGRIHPESIFNRLLELRPNSAEDRMKMQIVVEEMAADPDPNVLRQLEAEFVRYGEQSASHAEVAKRILEDIKNVRPAPASAPSTGRSALRAAYEGGQRPGSRLLTSPDDWTPDLSSWSPEIAAEVSRMVPREAQGLFHVTTNYGGVRKSSLKSGDDVPGSVGLGSAGAGKGRVSVTYDRRKAELIRDGLRLAGSIGRGESTAADVLAFFEGAHGLRLASDGYRTNRFGEGVFSPVGRLLSGKASSTVESLLPHLSPETKGWVEGGFQPVGNWDAEAMYDEIRTAASIVYDTPQKQAHLFKELDTSFWHGSPLPSSERPKLLLFGDAKSWSRIDPADVQILDLDVRRGALPEGGQDRSLSTWGREREFKASDFVIPGEQEMRFNPEDIRVRWDDMPAPAPATGRSALRAAYEAGKPEPVAPEPQTPAGKWALRPDVDPDDAQRLIPRSVSARLWKGTDRTIPDHVLMHYEKEIQHTLDGWIDEFMQTQAGALQDDRWDTPLPTLGPDEAWSEAVKDPKFRSLLETRDRIAAKIESLHSSPPPPTQTPAQTGEIPARDALIKTAERVCGEIGYMNCKLFVQGVSDVSRLETLPSRQYSSVPDLSPGEIIEWGDGLHYAIYLGDNEIMHVEEWGAPMSRSSIHDLEGGGVRVGDQVEDPPNVVMTPAAHPPSPPPPTPDVRYAKDEPTLPHEGDEPYALARQRRRQEERQKARQENIIKGKSLPNPVWGTPEFQRWNEGGDIPGRSVVTTNTGEPMVMYHSTTATYKDPNVFKPQIRELGTHFGTRQQADKRAQKVETSGPVTAAPTARQYPVHLRIKNPLRMADSGKFTARELSRQRPDVLSERDLQGIEQAARAFSSAPRPERLIYANDNLKGFLDERLEGVSGDTHIIHELLAPQELMQISELIDTWPGGHLDGWTDHPAANEIEDEIISILAGIPIRRGSDQVKPGLVGESIKALQEASHGVVDTPTDHDALRRWMTNQLTQKHLKEKGYDGIVYLNRFEARGRTNPDHLWEHEWIDAGSPSVHEVDSHPDELFSRRWPEAEDSYIIFDSVQAKSAIGNVGEFKEVPDISEARISPGEESYAETGPPTDHPLDHPSLKSLVEIGSNPLLSKEEKRVAVLHAARDFYPPTYGRRDSDVAVHAMNAIGRVRRYVRERAFSEKAYGRFSEESEADSRLLHTKEGRLKEIQDRIDDQIAKLQIIVVHPGDTFPSPPGRWTPSGTTPMGGVIRDLQTAAYANMQRPGFVPPDTAEKMMEAGVAAQYFDPKRGGDAAWKGERWDEWGDWTKAEPTIIVNASRGLDVEQDLFHEIMHAVHDTPDMPAASLDETATAWLSEQKFVGSPDDVRDAVLLDEEGLRSIRVEGEDPRLRDRATRAIKLVQANASENPLKFRGGPLRMPRKVVSELEDIVSGVRSASPEETSFSDTRRYAKTIGMPDAVADLRFGDDAAAIEDLIYATNPDEVLVSMAVMREGMYNAGITQTIHGRIGEGDVAAYLRTDLWDDTESHAAAEVWKSLPREVRWVLPYIKGLDSAEGRIKFAESFNKVMMLLLASGATAQSLLEENR